MGDSEEILALRDGDRRRKKEKGNNLTKMQALIPSPRQKMGELKRWHISWKRLAKEALWKVPLIWFRQEDHTRNEYSLDAVYRQPILEIIGYLASAFACVV